MNGIYLNNIPDRYTRTKPVESSLLRKIYEVFTKIVCDFWRTCASYFSKVPLSPELSEKVNGLQVDQVGSDTYIAVNQLKRQRTIGSKVITEYGAYLEKKFKGKLQFIKNFALPGMSDSLPNKDKSSELQFIFIPVVLEGTLRDHIVAMVYDCRNDRVEFYDSKGLTIQDHDELVAGRDEKTLSALLKEVIEKYGTENTKIWENTTKHQFDCHNCGVYVLNYIERRLNGQCFDTIEAKGPTYSEINNTIRPAMIQKLVSPS